MFEPLLDAASRHSYAASRSQVHSEVAECLPASFTLEDVLREILPSQQDDLTPLRAIQACVTSSQSVIETREDLEALIDITNHVVRKIEISTTSSSDDSAVWREIAFKGEVGLNVLQALSKLGGQRGPETLLVISAYTNSDDPWTTKASAATAQSMLSKSLANNTLRISFITNAILTNFLRPLFTKSRPETITSTGHKAAFAAPDSRGPSLSLSLSSPPESEIKPWKHTHRHALPIFETAVRGATPELLAAHWPLYTPVLLTLLDEPDAALKIRAQSAFRAFWARCPEDGDGALMRRVGLADVFEGAIFPAVLYLPSLTPEAESVRILDAAYSALMQIAGVVGESDEVLYGPGDAPGRFSAEQRKLLDKIIRKGVLVGYHHASDYVRITELLCRKTKSIVTGMGILAVKHLKDLIPMISGITTDAFGTKHPPALLVAVQLLHTVMQCCWPRIGVYSTEIIRILTVCFLNIEDEDSWPAGSPDKEQLKSELTRASTILAAIIETEGTALSEITSSLVKQEVLLKPLFTPQTEYSPDVHGHDAQT